MRNKQERHHIWSDQRIYQRTYQCLPQGSSYQSRGLSIANDDKPYECCNYQCQRMYCKRLQPVRISQLHLRFPFFASFAFFVAKIIGNWLLAIGNIFTLATFFTPAHSASSGPVLPGGGCLWRQVHLSRARRCPATPCRSSPTWKT